MQSHCQVQHPVDTRAMRLDGHRPWPRARGQVRAQGQGRPLRLVAAVTRAVVRRCQAVELLVQMPTPPPITPPTILHLAAAAAAVRWDMRMVPMWVTIPRRERAVGAALAPRHPLLAVAAAAAAGKEEQVEAEEEEVDVAAPLHLQQRLQEVEEEEEEEMVQAKNVSRCWPRPCRR